MGVRKQVVKSRGDLANKLTLMEGGLSQAKIGDIRQVLKLLVALEASGYYLGRKSIFVMLRKEAKALAERKLNNAVN